MDVPRANVESVWIREFIAIPPFYIKCDSYGCAARRATTTIRNCNLRIPTSQDRKEEQIVTSVCPRGLGLRAPDRRAARKGTRRVADGMRSGKSGRTGKPCSQGLFLPCSDRFSAKVWGNLTLWGQLSLLTKLSVYDII